ncbi:zinc-binding oxidoreductase ToxD [Multifurca ochricompacta]|uniref:Zinc-binding oxidoreductase ToxD n=1 Tax=Multifurca ochricompacta TaxID=376703 RepID=A0AAD4QJU4_9AGAM|nr:zinc-binding oxidoreductase ToxD [Multifurca ochricompacta]
MAPTKQRAAYVTENGITFGIVDVPKPGPGEILVKVEAAAQNPSDWKAAGRALKAENYGVIVGNDFAGTVVELGPGIPDGLRTVGERVAGYVRGSLGVNGAFSEYLVADAEFGILAIPEGWSFEQGAQLAIGPLTALQCGAAKPGGGATGHGRDILIWGGSTATGQYAIQFAKLNGLRVLTTASPKNLEFVKNLGADVVFDYRDENVVQKIRAATGNALEIAIDTVSEGKTPEQVTGSIGDKGGNVAILLPYESPRPDVKVTFRYVPKFLDRDSNGKWFFDLHKKIFASGKIKPNPVAIQPKGLASVREGLQFMQDGKVSAQKITYRISDTPAI